MHRNKSVSIHQFSMIPRADIPRSSFPFQKVIKKTMNASDLVPILVQEVLPGDSFNIRLTAFARLATPIFPVMDNLYYETFFFFVPNRLTWANWVRFCGEQDQPTDSISFTVPQITCPVGGYAVGSVYDHMGLPTVGQVGAGAQYSHSALPLRAFALIYNKWFRDENLNTGYPNTTGDGPDAPGGYVLSQRGKRKDYFTSCLPWPQKGATPVSLPLGTSAPIVATGSPIVYQNAAFTRSEQITLTSGSNVPTWQAAGVGATSSANFGANNNVFAALRTDLTAATSATINSIRLAFQTQRFLERDARGGTRYIELIRSHFGVISPDARQQRPEYIGGGSTPITINPIAQTSATGLTGGTAPTGTLAAMGSAVARHGFSYSSTEHGYIIGIANVRADLTYQQGLQRHWSRLTRYDFYWPAFAMLGEQAVLNKEIFCDGSANDALTFGYQERWAEYRYSPSEVHGLFRSTSAGTIDPWHLAQRFTVVPTLNGTFITESVPLSRVLAVGAAANGQQLLVDMFYDGKVARPLPMYSVPGMIDHF